MTTVRYEHIAFRPTQDGMIQGRFMKLYTFSVHPEQLAVLGSYSLEQDGSLTFPDADEVAVHNVMGRIVSVGLSPEHLRNSISKNPVNFLYRGCGVPIIGSNVFGVVDRGTSLIEVKPITSCNLHCTYCSVGEGGDEKKYDFVVEAEYLAQTVREVMAEKGLLHDDAGVEIHMTVHGEPFLYADMINLTKLLRQIPGVKHIATDSNGTLLTEQLVDDLAQAGFTRINISLDAIDPEVAYKMVGKRYNHQKLLDIIHYIAKHPRMDLLLAPVWMQGINDEEIEKVIMLAKQLDVVIGIQNFMNYKYGRNPQKEITWEEFKEKLYALEKKYDYKLVMNLPRDFAIYKVPAIKKTLHKNQVVDVDIKMHGNNPGEMLGVANDRVVTVPTKAKIGDRIAVRITRDKHNVYFGIPLKEKVMLDDVTFGNIAP